MPLLQELDDLFVLLLFKLIYRQTLDKQLHSVFFCHLTVGLLILKRRVVVLKAAVDALQDRFVDPHRPFIQRYQLEELLDQLLGDFLYLLDLFSLLEDVAPDFDRGRTRLQLSDVGLIDADEPTVQVVRKRLEATSDL